jgi:acyl carrier protein
LQPAADLERRIGAIWGELMGIEAIGPDDNFFELGGHSLLAAQMLARLKSEVGVDLPLEKVFESPTIRCLAMVAKTIETPVADAADKSKHEFRF